MKPGTKIIITTPRAQIHGTVIRADNWGSAEKPNWYIEYNIDEQKSIRESRFSGNYGYWKQGCDGGTVEVVE